MGAEQQPVIVQVCPCYVDLERESGGVSNIVRQLCLQLLAMGRTTVLLCGNKELGRTVAAERCLHWSPRLRLTVLGQDRHPLRLMRRLGAAIAALPSDSILHIHTCFSTFSEAAMARAIQRNLPFIFSPHGKLSAVALRRRRWPKLIWWHCLTRHFIRRADRIAVSSLAEARFFRAWETGLPAEVVPNGYEPPAVGAEFTGGQGTSRPYILFLGYLDPRKQPEFLVEVFARSRLRATHVLVFAGPDAYRHRRGIEAVIRARALRQDQVVFTGPVFGAEKWRLLRSAACLCLPSRAEGQPLVLAEALGAGLPSVYSADCNFPEIAVRGAGIMLTGFDPDSWGTAIENVCLDGLEAARMKQAALSMSGEYRWPRIARKWAALYDEVLESRRTRALRRGAWDAVFEQSCQLSHE